MILCTLCMAKEPTVALLLPLLCVQDVGILEYRAPSLAADLLSAAYRGNRGTAAVLDVACGTGLVCSEVCIFIKHFVFVSVIC